jgi:hypothetical protein
MQKNEKSGLLFDRFKIEEKGEETQELKTYFAADIQAHNAVSEFS